MTFDPKGMAKYSAFGTAGGIVLGAGIWWLLLSTVENLIRPLFNVVGGFGVINLGSGISIGWAAWLSAGIVFMGAVVVGFGMIRMAGKQ